MCDWKGLGNAAFSGGKYMEAAQIYSVALQRSPQDYKLYSNRAAAYIAAKEYELGLKDADECVNLAPDWFKGYARRGEAHRGMNNLELAIKDYEDALEKEPESTNFAETITDLKDSIYDSKTIVFLKQLQPGRDFCLPTRRPIASLIYRYAIQMRNFVYLVGDAKNKKVLIVDACWDTSGILKVVNSLGLTVVGLIVTHRHFDHTGGLPPPPYDQYRISVEGVYDMLKAIPHIPVYIHELDADEVIQNCSLPQHRVVKIRHRDQVLAGDVKITFLHTPGHTAGSVCVKVGSNRILSGDTLFFKSCGRMDLPGSDPKQMHHSLQTVLRPLPDSTEVYPGHAYGRGSSTIGFEKEEGMLAALSFEEWESKFQLTFQTTREPPPPG